MTNLKRDVFRSTAREIMKRTISFVVAVLLSQAVFATAQTESRPFVHNGYARAYIIHRPVNVGAHPAVVFMLGGIGSTAKSESAEFGWIDVADRNGFLVVFPELVATQVDQPMDPHKNISFWEMKGSRTHKLGSGMMPVDDEGYLMAVVRDVLRRDHPNPKRVFFAGFSSGSGMVQLMAARHSRMIRGVVAVATPLMEPPPQLERPVPILYIHGDKDEQFTAFETNSPNFATTPHGNWVTWGYLNGCRIQTATRMSWGVQLVWQQCRNGVPVVADFIAGFGHEWAGSVSASGKKPGPEGLDFTEMAWQFLAAIK
jgi:polyhydroxybutyrate depolymerase